MPTLDLYKKRKSFIVKLANGNTYNIPCEFTVEEVERLLELREDFKEIDSATVSEDATEAQDQVVKYWGNIFNQLEIIFQSLQPEMTIEQLKREITHKEALEIIGFFDEYRTLAVQKEDQSKEIDTKKKLKI